MMCVSIRFKNRQRTPPLDSDGPGTTGKNMFLLIYVLAPYRLVNLVTSTHKPERAYTERAHSYFSENYDFVQNSVDLYHSHQVFFFFNF